ncbi:MAG TPA: hypothetical protein VGS11_10795 [Candidatus Bathyarchaeia archaeon]|nr:hypothetical protein [Candidatus Bathyarchaeia archaeon]
MKPHHVFGTLLWIVAIVIFIFGNAAALGLQSTVPLGQPFYYTCTVSSATNIGVSNCYMFLIGPEPDGSFYSGAGLSFYSTICVTQASQWNPSITWAYSPGNTTVGIAPAAQHYKTLPSQITVQWSISVTGIAGSGSGSVILKPTQGTNSFNPGNFNPGFPNCVTTTTTSSSNVVGGSSTSTTSTSSSSTTLTSTSGTITTQNGGGVASSPPPPRAPSLDPISTGIAGALGIAGVVFFVPRRVH